MNRWIEAARPRTLPLALANILLGNFLAYSKGSFHLITALLTLATTLFLQILSNFANDYGDSKKGIDNADRKVALRTVQTGKISLEEMKKAIIILIILSLISGIGLIYVSLGKADFKQMGIFFGLGIFSILASIGYTLGKKPYGYLGLGDLFVFLFFGLVGTLGSFYLQSLIFDFWILLPASGIGFLSVAVLNLNNLRDWENDQKNGKKSLIVRIGYSKGIIYQKALYLLGVLTFLIYQVLFGSTYAYWILTLGIIPIIKLFFDLDKNLQPEALDPFLKRTALSTLWLVAVFGASLLLKF